jgi:ribosomal protein S16
VSRASLSNITDDPSTPNINELTAGRATITVTFAAGQSTAQFYINAVDNLILDGNATVTITASASDATYEPVTKSLSVVDNEQKQALTLSINVASILESAGASAATGTITRSGPVDTALVVALSSNDPNSATVPTTVTIPAGQASTTFTIGAVDDAIADGDKAVTISAKVLGYTDATDSISVLDNETTAPLTVSINDVRLVENTGSKGFVFTVTLSQVATSSVAVLYATGGGSATVGSDYKSTSGTLVIPAGQTTGYITVIVNGDFTPESNETFYVTLLSANGAALGKSVGVGTILNDDGGGTSIDTIGLYNPLNAKTYLRTTNTAGVADITFQYGPGGANWQILSGDWNGDGVITVGLYNSATSIFYLKDSNSAGAATTTFVYNPAGANAIPVVGDWDGNGTDTVGFYDPTTATFYLKNSNAAGDADLTFVYGTAGAGLTPIVGDWDGNGTDTVGTYDSATATFKLRNTNTAGNADAQFVYGPGGAGWKPFAGDWNGDGVDTIGLYNQTTSKFYLRNANAAGAADQAFQYGPTGSGWMPIIGDWNGAGLALSAADGVADADAVSIRTSQLQPIIQEAMARWTHTGLSASDQAALARVKFIVADLSGSKLGLADGDTIYIDKDAAGHGWFVDATPSQDEEFANGRAVDPRAIDGIDLLTVVEHELGHILGKADVDASLNELMSETLSEGVRRDATAEVDAVFAAI